MTVYLEGFHYIIGHCLPFRTCCCCCAVKVDVDGQVCEGVGTFVVGIGRNSGKVPRSLARCVQGRCIYITCGLFLGNVGFDAVNSYCIVHNFSVNHTSVFVSVLVVQFDFDLG